MTYQSDKRSDRSLAKYRSLPISKSAVLAAIFSSIALLPAQAGGLGVDISVGGIGVSANVGSGGTGSGNIANVNVGTGGTTSNVASVNVGTGGGTGGTGGTGGLVDVSVGVGGTGGLVDVSVGVGGTGGSGGTGGAGGTGGTGGTGGARVPPVVVVSTPVVPNTKSKAMPGGGFACAASGNSEAYSGFRLIDKDGQVVGKIAETWDESNKIRKVWFQTAGNKCLSLSGGQYRVSGGDVWVNAPAKSFM